MSFHSSRGRLFTGMMLIILLFVTGCQNLTTETLTATLPQATSAEKPATLTTESSIAQTEDETSPFETEAPAAAEPTPAPTLADCAMPPLHRRSANESRKSTRSGKPRDVILPTFR